jgi:hypothetical protein
MIIYNKTWLNNLYLHNQADNEHASDCLTEDELKAIKQKYPVGFYTPGIFARIGLFILTCIIASFSFGLISLVMMQGEMIDKFGWPLFLAAITVAPLLIFIKKENHYHSGIDDALLWITCGLLTVSFCMLIYSSGNAFGQTHYLAISIFIFILSLRCTLSFVNVVMSAIACISFFAALFFTWKNLGVFGNTTMPFIMIIAAAIVYVVSQRLSKQLKAPYYINCINDVQIISLLVLYAAGNFLVINELNNSLNDYNTLPRPVPFGFFFWGWTILLPLIYIAFGLIKKDRILLRTGLLLVAAAIYTFRTYHHVLSIEAALIAGGIILIAIAYGTTKYLKTPKQGFTNDDTDNADTTNNNKLEALMTASTLGHTQSPAGQVNKFGGGDFGGGGSGGNF